MKDKLLELLKEVNADIDFENEKMLVDDEILDSLEVIQIVSNMEDCFGIEIDPYDVVAENFNSIEAMQALIEKSK